MRIKLFVFAILALCWHAFPHQASAQTINCASQDGGRQFCPADTRGGVTMVKQNSNSPCVQGQTWDWDGRGIWVDRGCRADFQVGNSYPGGPGGPGPGPGYGSDTITCESSHNRRNYCPIGNVNSNVEMIQQISQAPCVRGSTWGNDGQGIWVDSGCRASFRVPAGGTPAPAVLPRTSRDTARAFSGKPTIQTTTSAWTGAPALPFFPTDSTIRSARYDSTVAQPSSPSAKEISAAHPLSSATTSQTCATSGCEVPTIRTGTTGSVRSASIKKTVSSSSAKV
jgi:Protein of unknown function (DUF3011)